MSEKSPLKKPKLKKKIDNAEVENKNTEDEVDCEISEDEYQKFFGDPNVLNSPKEEDDCKITPIASIEDNCGDNGDLKFNIEDLPKVGETAAKKLRDSGYETINSIAATPSKLLSEQTGIGEKTAKEITSAAREMLDFGFQSGMELWEKRKNLVKISTGSKKLDEILGGGIETGSLTEFNGEYRTGKTQIMLQLCINAQLPKKDGGAEGKVIFVDTEGTFRPERIIQMAKAKGLDPIPILNNIQHGKVISTDHQINAVKGLSKMIVKDNFKLVIVDSIISHFRAEYIGRGSITERQQILNQHIHDLLRIADTFPDIAVVFTNQVSSKPDVFFGDPNSATGGNIVGHASTIRVALKKGKGEQRIARIEDAPDLPERDAVFLITENGIEDI